MADLMLFEWQYEEAGRMSDRDTLECINMEKNNLA
jgi:hypothetical protein